MNNMFYVKTLQPYRKAKKPTCPVVAAKEFSISEKMVYIKPLNYNSVLYCDY
jgi:hypothetical protein